MISLIQPKSQFDIKMDTKNTPITSAASLVASAMLVRALVNEFLPKTPLSFATNFLSSRLSTHQTIVIQELEGWTSNSIYNAVETYLATKITTSSNRVKATKPNRRNKKLTVSLEHGAEMTDVYEGIQFKWRSTSRRTEIVDQGNIVRIYELTFHESNRDVVFDKYLPFVLGQAEAIQSAQKKLRIYLNGDDHWRALNLHHPATFDTVAMEPDVKNTVMNDLAMFAERKEYYKKIGKAWKRGYLIHGPPGTGKSSLVAAMANYLKFDIHDLDLTEVRSNVMLKRLLVRTRNKSILVVENIDCSGRMGFADGLWSSCGEERIVVFTTNCKDRLDPALLRAGWIDMEIEMGYCGVIGFRTLVRNYHGVEDHTLFGEVEELIGEAKVTPAEVAEVLMMSEEAECALRGVVRLIGEKKERGSEVEEDYVKYVSNVSDREMPQMTALVLRGGRGSRSQCFRGGRGGRTQSYGGRGNGRGKQVMKTSRGRGR